MEEAVRVFKKEIPWDFIDYEKTMILNNKITVPNNVYTK